MNLIEKIINFSLHLKIMDLETILGLALIIQPSTYFIKALDGMIEHDASKEITKVEKTYLFLPTPIDMIYMVGVCAYQVYKIRTNNPEKKYFPSS